MRTTSVLVGVVFGLVGAGVLALPLAISLPGRAVTGWWYVSHEVGLLAMIACFALPALAGFAAARLDPDDPIRAGAGASMVGTLLAGALVVMPASVVSPVTDLFLAVSGGEVVEAELRELLTAALLGLQRVPALSGAFLLLTAPAFGAVGGLVYDVGLGSGNRVARLVHRSSVPMVASWVVFAASLADVVWCAHADIAIFPRLQHSLSLVDRAELGATLGVSAVAQSLLLAWMLRDALLLLRARRRLFGLAWGASALLPVVSSGLATLIVYPKSLMNPMFWLAGGMVSVTAIGTAVVHWATEAELHERPRTFWDLVGEGTAMGVVTVSLAAFCGLTPILGTALLAYPFLLPLLGGAGAVDHTPMALLLRVYGAHAVAGLVMVLVAAAYSVVATPVWLVARSLFVRASRRGR